MGPMKEAIHWWSGLTQAQRDGGALTLAALCKKKKVLGSGWCGSRAERQSNGSEVGVDVLSVCHVGGRASEAAPPEGPFEAAGGGERPGCGAAAAGVACEFDGREGELA